MAQAQVYQVGAFLVYASSEYQKHVADDLNNWADSVAQFSTQAQSVSASDSLSNWADAQAIQLLVTVSEAVADSLNNWADVANIFQGYSISDNLNNWADSIIVVGVETINVSDSFPGLSDYVVVLNPKTVEKSDSLNNWADSVTLSDLGDPQLTFTDSLNNWADALAMVRVEKLEVSDLMFLTDSIELRKGVHLVKTDSLANWADAQVINLIAGTGPSVADDLNNWDDDVTATLNSRVITSERGGLTDYIRRYLGDPS